MLLHALDACSGWPPVHAHKEMRRLVVHTLKPALGSRLQGTISKEGNGAPKQTPAAVEALQKLRRKHPVRDIALRTWW